jgi:hypothetical protein
VIIAFSNHSVMGSDVCQTMGEARGVAGYPRPAAEWVISSHRLSPKVIVDQGTYNPIVMTMK